MLKKPMELRYDRFLSNIYPLIQRKSPYIGQDLKFLDKKSSRTPPGFDYHIKQRFIPIYPGNKSLFLFGL